MRLFKWFLSVFPNLISFSQQAEGPGSTSRSAEYAALQKNLAQGWNTWNTRSVLSHVLLPEGFALNLGIKEYRQGGYLKEALIGRRGTGDEVIAPGPHAYDGSYTELNLRWREIEIKVQSATENGSLVLLVTPFHRQKRTPLLVAESGFLWNRKGELSTEDGALIGRCRGRTIRVFSTKNSVVEPYITAQTPYLAIALDGPLGLSTDRRRSLEEIAAIVDKGKKKTEESHNRYGEYAEVYRALQVGLAWNIIYDPLKDRVITPVSRLWNLGWDELTVGEQSSVGDPVQYLGCVLFCWDTYFAGYLFSLENKELAYANVIEITKEKMPAGYVPMWYRSLGIKTQDRSQPPVGSLVVREIYRRYEDRWFLEEIFDDLLGWNRWWPNYRLNKGYLSWGSFPYEPVVGFDWESKGVNDLYGAALESGMDNLPLYDNVPFNKKNHMMEMADVGLISYYVADCDALADIAKILDKMKEEKELRSRAELFRQKLASLWSEEKGLFLNRRTDTGEFSQRLSPTLFFPLLARAATPEQAERMIREHFFNPKEFWGEWVMPSISRDDPAYKDNVYWRGRIWPPMNFLVYLGLRNYNLPRARADLAEKSKNLLLKAWRERNLIPENYNADTGEGCDVTSSDHFYHWGGLLGLLFLIEKGLVTGPETPLPSG